MFAFLVALRSYAATHVKTACRGGAAMVGVCRLVLMSLVVSALAGPAAAQQKPGNPPPLAVRVLDAQGLPIAGASVEARTAGGRQAKITDSGGAVELPAEFPVEIEVRATAFEPEVRRVEAPPAAPVIFRLVPAAARATADVVVTATRTETAASNLPVSVQLVDRDDIEGKQFNNPNIGEIVRDVPGVSVGHGNRNIPNWIHLRGTGYFIGRTLYMVDELPLAEPMTSIAVNPANVGSAEVLLGPSSSLYGANASGGVVNVRSLTARQRGGMTVGLGYGTFETWRPQLSAGKVAGHWDLFASYGTDKSDGYKNTDLATGLYLMQNGYPSYLNSVTIENQHYTNTYTYGRAAYRNPGSGAGFTVAAHVFNEDLYGGRQNALTTGTRVIATGSVFTPVAGAGVLTVRFGYQSRQGDTQSPKGLLKVANSAIADRYVFTAIDDTSSYVYDPTINQHSHTTYTRAPLDAQMDLRAWRGHLVTVGGQYMADQSRSFTLSADRSGTLAQTRYGIGQTAAYAQDQFRFLDERAMLLLGARYDWWRYHNVYDTGSTNRTPPDVSKGAATYRGGFKYQIADSWGIRTSAGTAFWPGAATWFFQNISTGTTWREANPGLKPERTRMIDFGADYASPNGRTRVSATGYWGRIIDAMSYVYDQHPTLPGVQIIRTSNSDQVSIKGLELGLRQRVLGGLSAYANYTLNRSEITRSAKNTGHQLRNAPDNVGGAGLEYVSAAKGWGATLAVRASSSRYYDDENTQFDYFHMRAYGTLGAKAWKTFSFGGQKVDFSVGVDNLTDSKYDGEFIYNAPGRFVEVRATYRLGL
jgi:iron complex outermembrane recepter protein